MQRRTIYEVQYRLRDTWRPWAVLPDRRSAMESATKTFHADMVGAAWRVVAVPAIDRRVRK